ncbi:MAG: hypothetical protein ABI451_07800 [Dokdonella sp.]
MKSNNHAILALAAAGALVVLGGCSGSSNTEVIINPTPPVDDTFVTFVKSLLANTTDAGQPSEVNGFTYTFTEDPTAFDSVVGSP